MKFKRLFALLLLGMCLSVANTAEAVGAVGPQGPTGKKGPTGDKGLRGDKGATGNTGATGATGRTGAAGPKGGAKGDKGLQGDKGDAGTQIANGTNTGDTLVWNGSAWTPTASGCLAPYIMDDIGPHGGIVYYVDGSGCHGLAAQANDEASEMNWTDAMVAAQAHNNPACPTAILKTPTCWHVPTNTELKYFYEYSMIVGGNEKWYWSSTKENDTNMFAQRFPDGFISIRFKTEVHFVRAVMAF